MQVFVISAEGGDAQQLTTGDEPASDPNLARLRTEVPWSTGWSQWSRKKTSLPVLSLHDNGFDFEL
jgi:hypothetical protein